MYILHSLNCLNITLVLLPVSDQQF